MRDAIIFLVLAFGFVCTIYSLLRSFGMSEFTAIDKIAFVGQFCFPFAWFIYGIVMPIAKFVDWQNEREYKKKYPDFK